MERIFWLLSLIFSGQLTITKLCLYRAPNLFYFTFCFIEPSRFFLHLVKHRIKSTFLLRAQSPAECSLLGIHTKFIYIFFFIWSHISYISLFLKACPHSVSIPLNLIICISLFLILYGNQNCSLSFQSLFCQ